MTAFRYEAARSDGGLVRGLLEATSEPAAAAVLSARGLYPILVESSPVPDTRYPFGFGRPSRRAQATVFQSLAAFVEAGVPLERAIQATERVASGPLPDALGRVAQRVREGSSLGMALASEGSFSAVTVGLVRAGERGVGLGAALSQAAAQLEREAETETRVRTALTYPTLLAVVGSGAIALIVLFVNPRFAVLLSDAGQQLPTATRLLLTLSAAVRCPSSGRCGSRSRAPEPRARWVPYWAPARRRSPRSRSPARRRGTRRWQPGSPWHGAEWRRGKD